MGIQASAPKQELAALQASLKDYYPIICTLLVGGQVGPGGSGGASTAPSLNISGSSGGLNTSGGAMGGGAGGVGGGIGGEEGKATMESFSSALALLEPDVRTTAFLEKSPSNGNASIESPA
jgi:hypothetical protein